MAVIEDDYDHEFHYEGRPVLPLASTDAAGSVIYVGTLSKVLAPGLRLGYVVAPPPLLERLVVLRSCIDLQGDAILEAAVAELISDGEVQRQVRRVRRAYHARRDVLAAALHTQLGDAVSFTTPGGGMALWLRARPDISIPAWEREAAAHGVQFQPGRRFAFDGRERQQLRLGFAGLDERKLREAAKRLATSLQAARKR
jgi:GntR family transcriptional regulator/MocR family aminotransferase